MVTQTRQQGRDNLSSEQYWFKRTYRQWKIRLLRHKRDYQIYCQHVATRQRRQWLNSLPDTIRAEREFTGFPYRALYVHPTVTKEDTKNLFNPFHPTGGVIDLRQNNEPQSAPCPGCMWYDDGTQRWYYTNGTCPEHGLYA